MTVEARDNRQAVCAKRNTEARSCNHCCSGKEKKYYIFWGCVCSLRHPARNAHASYCIVICGLSGYTSIPHYLIKGTIFAKKNQLNIKCMFLFPLQLPSETFLIIRRIQRVMIINVHNLYVKYPLFNVNKNPSRCYSMQIFIYCKVTLHVSGVTAPIIRSTKNCNRSLRYRSYNTGTATSLQRGLIRPRWREVGCGYSF